MFLKASSDFPAGIKPARACGKSEAPGKIVLTESVKEARMEFSQEKGESASP